MSRHSDRLTLSDSEHRQKYFKNYRTDANVAYDLLTYNTELAIPTIESNSK